MRKSTLLLLSTLINLILLILMFAHAFLHETSDLSQVNEKARMVQDLGLTDLCLFTEASYTRHLSQSDVHTPFQNHPLALEHFPSGSLLKPPPMVRKLNETLD
jgi:hypothetical protein